MVDRGRVTFAIPLRTARKPCFDVLYKSEMRPFGVVARIGCGKFLEIWFLEARVTNLFTVFWLGRFEARHDECDVGGSFGS